MIYTIDDMDIEGDAGAHICGEGIFDVETGDYINSDIGGEDGQQITSCEFTGVNLFGLTIPAADIKLMIGASGIETLEDQMRAIIKEGAA